MKEQVHRQPRHLPHKALSDKPRRWYRVGLDHLLPVHAGPAGSRAAVREVTTPPAPRPSGDVPLPSGGTAALIGLATAATAIAVRHTKGAEPSIRAGSNLADRLEGFRVGAVDFISKPFQREELLARVRTHLELARLRARLEERVAERTAELRESERLFTLLIGKRVNRPHLQHRPLPSCTKPPREIARRGPAV